MLSQRASPACEIALHTASEDIYVRPPPRGSHLPGADQTFSGLVELLCPTERTIGTVNVSLKGIQTLMFPDKTRALGVRHEEKIVLHKTLELTARPIPTTGLPGTIPPPPFPGDTAETDESRSVASTSTEGSQSSELPAELASDMAPTESASVTQEGLQLTPGVHGFEYTFIIPSTTAASLAPTRNASLRYILTATAVGAGRGGRGDVSTWKEVQVIAQVQQDGGPTALDLEYRDYHEALGVLSLSLMSASLTVGGVAAVEVHHPDPPPGVAVHAIRVYLEQTLELFSTEKNQWLRLPADKLRLWEKGRMPYASPRPDDVMPKQTIWFAQTHEDGSPAAGRPGWGAGPGRPTMSPFGLSLDGTFASYSIAGPPQLPPARAHGYTLQSIVRLPDHRAMRPSTVRGSQTNIRVTHEIGMEVFFSRLHVLDQRASSDTYGLPKVQVFSMRRAVLVPSCACTHDTVHLPPYSLEAPPYSPPASCWTSRAASRAASPRSSSEAASPDSQQGASPTDGHLSPTSPAESEGRTMRSSLSSLRLGRRSRPSSPEHSERGAGKKKPEPIPNLHDGSPPLTPLRPILRARKSHTSALAKLGKLGQFSPASPGQAQSGSRTSLDSGATPGGQLASAPPQPAWPLSPYGATHSAHARCTCSQRSDELAEGEQRLLGGKPTAPGYGVWLDARTDEFPPWSPGGSWKGMRLPPFVNQERWAAKEVPLYVAPALGQV